MIVKFFVSNCYHHASKSKLVRAWALRAILLNFVAVPNLVKKMRSEEKVYKKFLLLWTNWMLSFVRVRQRFDLKVVYLTKTFWLFSFKAYFYVNSHLIVPFWISRFKNIDAGVWVTLKAFRIFRINQKPNKQVG